MVVCDGAAQVTVQYNLCNEPWTKYSMSTVADRGLKPSQWTSARLHNQVLYLETHRCRPVPPAPLSLPHSAVHARLGSEVLLLNRAEALGFTA